MISRIRNESVVNIGRNVVKTMAPQTQQTVGESKRKDGNLGCDDPCETHHFAKRIRYWLSLSSRTEKIARVLEKVKCGLAKIDSNADKFSGVPG